MLNPRLIAFAANLCLVVLIDAGFARIAAAQDSSFPSARGPALEQSPLEQFRQRLQQGLSATAGIPMEGAIDADAYIVGPGDVFSVYVGGPRPTTVAIPVTADGRLILPEVGSIPAADRSLADIRRDAVDALTRRYSNVSLDVSLAQPRQFYVHVVGAVPIPGRYLALPVARVSDVLQLAFADTTTLPVSNFAYRPSLRNVDLTRRDGESVSVDLARYFSTGETDFNPYVRDGDVVNVGAFRVDERAVFVNGAVPFPGTYDHRPDDTLEDLLFVAGLRAPYSGIASVQLVRREADGSLRTWNYTAAELRDQARGIPVQPLDHVSVEPQRVKAGIASVDGFVRFPGKYDVTPGETTLQDLVQMAGGLRDDALPSGAHLIRNVLPDPEPLSLRSNRFEQNPLLDLSKLAADTVAIMRYLRQSDMDFLSRAQFAQGLRVQNRVSVNLSAALEPGAAPIYLQDGDRLVVPQDKQSVFVFGQVENPGYVAYEPGLSPEDYIARAGGRSNLGSKAYVVEAGTGRYLPSRGAVVGSGDLIFVDSRIDVADTAEMQRLMLEEKRAASQERMQWVQLITQTVVGVASFLAVYLSLNR